MRMSQKDGSSCARLKTPLSLVKVVVICAFVIWAGFLSQVAKAQPPLTIQQAQELLQEADEAVKSSVNATFNAKRELKKDIPNETNACLFLTASLAFLTVALNKHLEILGRFPTDISQAQSTKLREAINKGVNKIQKANSDVKKVLDDLKGGRAIAQWHVDTLESAIRDMHTARHAIAEGQAVLGWQTPTLSHWGLIILAVLVAGSGIWLILRKRRAVRA